MSAAANEAPRLLTIIGMVLVTVALAMRIVRDSKQRAKRDQELRERADKMFATKTSGAR